MKMAKQFTLKSLSLFLTVLMLIGTVSATVPMIADAAVEYTEGEYTYTVSGGNAKIVSFPETSGGDIEIPSKLGGYKVTEIGSYSFYACTTLDSVVIPSTVTTIGNYAFAYCVNLSKVSIPSSVTSIGTNTFKNSNSVAIACEEGSYAYKYAKEKGIEVVADSKDNTLKRLDGSNYNYKYYYSDSFFFGSTTEYNHDLCLVSACFAMQAGTPDESRNDKAYNAEYMLKNIGFDYWKSYGYESDPTFNSIACVVGSKEGVIINDKKTTIIAVAVRGQGYRAEWGGNANVGNGVHHNGFEIAAKKVLVYLDSYMANHYEDSNVIFWVSGYSRSAATANIVASVLNNGAKDYANISGARPSKNKVFAYTFATPMNTTDKNANTSSYNNIFNIINPIDLVPAVAPAEWGFTRYGVNYFLPAKEYYTGYDTIYEKMQKNYKNITGSKYSESFVFYEFSFWGFCWKENETIGQMTFINHLVDILANDALKSRKNYTDHYQNAATKLIAMLMGDWKGGSGSKNLLKSIANILSENILDILLEEATGSTAWQSAVASVIASNTELDYDEAYEMMLQLDDALFGILSHPNYLYTAIQFAAQGTDKFFGPHFIDVYFSWLTLVGQDGITVNDVLKKAKNYKELKVNCPVDVNVYNNEGRLVASIIDNEAVYIGENSLSYYVDENGQKCISIPDDEEYRVEIDATDSGMVNCSVHEFDDDGSTVKRITNYRDIAVEKGDAIICNADNSVDGDEGAFTVTDPDGCIVVPSAIIQNSDINDYFVVAKCSTSNAAVVLGGGRFKLGEFAQVSIQNSDAYSFVGWFVDGNLVSKDKTYRFIVESDVEIVAECVFVGNLTIKTPSTTTINYGDTLILHADLGESALPAGYSIEWTADGNGFKLEPAEDGMTCNVTSVQNGKVTVTATLVDADGNPVQDADGNEISASQELNSKVTFWQKIVSFFKNIFRIPRIILQSK